MNFTIILLLATTYTTRLEFIDIPQLPFEEAKDWWLEESFKVLVRVMSAALVLEISQNICWWGK